MIAEGIIALIWAMVSSYFFYAEPTPGYQLYEQTKSMGILTPAPIVVNTICKDWLGLFGGIIAIIGVVACPLASGDTAFRSARLIISESFNITQKAIKNRLYICIPLFSLAIAILIWQISNPDGFNVLWKFFGWANQTLATIALWTATIYLVKEKKFFYISLIPAIFMTCVCTTFFIVSKECLGLPMQFGYIATAIVAPVSIIWFVVWYRKQGRK